MKSRILIHIHYMALGGAELALLGLLNALDPQRVEVDLLLNQHTGEFMPLIPEYVHLLPEQRGYNAIERPMRDIVHEGQWRIALARLHARWQHRCYLKTLTPEQRAYDASIFQYVADCVTPVLPPIAEANTPYDLAISFLTPHNIVLDKVKARKKVAWIHTDYSTIHVNVEKELRVWSRYDYIASISDDCTNAFLQKFPTLKDKVFEIENIISTQYIREKALQIPHEAIAREIKREDGVISIISVGRFVHAKNYDNVPAICKRVRELIKQNGQSTVRDVKWYIIGYGLDEHKIRLCIEQEGMEDHVIILGKKNNPYPYIAASDIYAQPSRYEGKSITVREAQILCKPVVVTNYLTASSQIDDGETGFIVSLDNEGCARGLAQVILNEGERSQIIYNLQNNDFGYGDEVNKIYKLLEN